jgi:hypothetical protein
MMGARRELQREDAVSRALQYPFLQAETDRQMYRQQQANLAREALIMKDVPGWEVSLSCPSHPKSTEVQLADPLIVILCALIGGSVDVPYQALRPPRRRRLSQLQPSLLPPYRLVYSLYLMSVPSLIGVK